MTAPAILALPVLDRSFYAQNTLTVARDLVGNFLVLHANTSELKIGRIIETEAYPGLTDKASKASHSYRGITPRTAVLFEEAGSVYVYLIYGIYYCLNVVSGSPESGGAVLIRAVEPLFGLAGKTSGPGLTCKAYGIDRSLNGTSAVTGPLRIYQSPELISTDSIITLPRVGIDYAGEDKAKKYRFRLVCDQ
jgi:DNA-3-methyladenine glycosylase